MRACCFELRLARLTFLSFFVFFMQFYETAAMASEFLVYRSEISQVRFQYDNELWVVGTPVEPDTEFVVRWTTQSNDALLATCFLKSKLGGIGEVQTNEVHQYLNEIVDLRVQSEQDRSQSVEVTDARSLWADNVPVVYIVLRLSLMVTDENFQAKELHMVLHSFTTSWKGREILLACGYDAVIETVPAVQARVVDEINRVLRTLQFEGR